MSRIRLKLAAMAAFAALGLGSMSQALFLPPSDTVTPDHNLSSLHDDLAAGHWSDAADRVESILTSTTPLAKVDDRILPIAAYVNEQLTDAAARTAFAAAYEKVAGQPASAALSAAVQAGDTTAIAAVAARYPWTAAAGRVRGELAKRLGEIGDMTGVQSLVHGGGADVPPSLFALADTATDSTAKPILFTGAWYNRFRPIDFPRVVPVSAKDLLMVATPTAIAAVNGQGKLLWSAGQPMPEMVVPPQGQKQPVGIQILLYSQRPLSEPALWCDPSGVARVAIVRQSLGDASTLTAYRPADGSLLWSTGSGDTASLQFLGTPLVKGRYVYSLALDYQPPAPAKMTMVALDLPNGRLLWRTPLGDAAPTSYGMIDARMSSGTSFIPHLIATTSAQLSADDTAVYACLEGGSVASLDRFGGQLNWLSGYPTRTFSIHEFDRMKQAKKNPPLLHRWRDRVSVDSKVAVVAPTDSSSVIAYDTTSGKQLWKNDVLDAADLVGAVAGRFVLAGTNLCALKADGSPDWTVEYANTPVGPPFIDGNAIVAPTQSGITVYAADTGASSLKPPAGLLSVDLLQKQVPTKKALDALGLLDYFKAAPQDATPEPPKKNPEKPAKTDKTDKPKKLK